MDDGTPLGREGARGLRIDSLSQSFAVLCGLNASHTGTALDTALRQLEDGENGLLKLFAPPFGQPDKRVGYTSSYPAGVRENGGQYTHAAAWLAIALFEAGRPEDGTRVLRLLNTIAKYTDGLGEKYRGEPYALAGDVYANPACPGRVGWSQYTGAAGVDVYGGAPAPAGAAPPGERDGFAALPACRVAGVQPENHPAKHAAVHYSGPGRRPRG